jgi:hypothetical protein
VIDSPSIDIPETIWMRNVMTKVGEGETSEVFRVASGVVVKLFRPGCYSEEVAVAREYATAKYVGDHSDLAPRVFERVEIDGRPGYSMEELIGPCFQDVIDTDPESLGSYAAVLGEAHRSLHAIEISGTLSNLPSMVDVFPNVIGTWDTFRADVRSWLVSLLQNLAGEPRLGHGDFMPYNMILVNGAPRAVDWAETGLAPPLTDVARTINFINDPTDFPQSAYTVNSSAFIRDYLDAYCDGVRPDWTELHNCLILNAAGECHWANLSQQTDTYSQRLFGFVNANFAEYGSDLIVARHEIERAGSN